MKILSTIVCVFVLFSVSMGQNFKEMGTFNYRGVPEYLDPNMENMSPELLQNIQLLLPDGKNMETNNPSLYQRNTLSYITLKKTSDVYLAFISEGADFKSSVGFYTFSGNPPSSVYQINSPTIVFPNVSDYNSGGGLTRGNRVKLGNFPAGTSIGFFLISNAYKYGRVLPMGNESYYTDSRYNPERNSNLKKHTVLLYDERTDRFVLLFEDFNREGGSDHDFNDAIFVISTGSSGTMETKGSQEIEEETKIITNRPGNPVPQQPTPTPVPDKKMTICHYPPGNTDNPIKLVISESAWPAHEAHGDYPGECGKEVIFNPEGKWKLECQDPELTITRTSSGIMVKSDNSQHWYAYKNTGSNRYEDEKGNVYVFESDYQGSWASQRELGPFHVAKVSQETTPVQDDSEKITICHLPPGNRDNPQQITIPTSAWKAHQAHGDSRGPCPSGKPGQPSMEFDVSGSWVLQGRNQVNSIRLTPTGIEVKSDKSPKWFYYEKSSPNIYRDAAGNEYGFTHTNEGYWKSRNGKTTIVLKRKNG